MINISDTIDSINKQSAIVCYIATTADVSGLSELLTDVSKALDLCAVQLEQQTRKNDE